MSPRSRIIEVLQALVIAVLFVSLAYRAGWLSWVTGR